MTRRWPLVCLALLGLAAPAGAQPKPPKPTVLHLRPAGEPDPALKYRLLPELRDLTPGNAALGYHRAIEMVLEGIRNRSNEDGEKLLRWQQVPLKDLPRDEVREYLARFGRTTFDEIDLAARRERCDWGNTSRLSYELRIPEIHNARELGRLVALRARLAVAEGKSDEAVEAIQTGLALARHVGDGPMIIQSLVGTAIAHLMFQPLEDLIEASGTPSLYWALSDFPRPFIDLRAAWQGESRMLENEFPILREVEDSKLSPERMRDEPNAMLRKLERFTSQPGNRPFWQTQVGAAAVVAKVYPKAKRALIEQGRTPAEVEAMPALQVVAISSLRNYRRIRDDLHKWMNLPYWEAYEGLEKAERQSTSCARDMEEGIPLASLLPAMKQVYLAEVRTDRRIAALRCIEAIRMYAAAHAGKPPASLGDVDDAPIPTDPATGKPFEYTASGTRATLSAPPPPGQAHQSYAFRYELILQP